MEDFIRAKRLQGTFYEPLYDQDLSQFPTSDMDDEEPLRPDSWGIPKPQTIEDIWDDEYGEFGNDLSDFEWYPKIQPLLN
jgi:trans-2-enoyl-CoA reductase